MVKKPGKPEGNAPTVWDRVFRCLASEPRRQIVFSLAEADANEWHSLPGAAFSPNISQDKSQLEISLQHEHLPHLADRNYVVWDRDPFQVRQGVNFQEVLSIIDILTDSSSRLPDQFIQGCDRLER